MPMSLSATRAVRVLSQIPSWRGEEYRRETAFLRMMLNDFGVSISLLSKTSELRDTSEEPKPPRHISGLKIRPELGRIQPKT